MRVAEKVYTLRPGQTTAVAETMTALVEDQNVLMDAPTGSGKSVIGAEIAKRFEGTSVYLADNINLVEQMVREHPQFVTIKGHANYCPAPWRCDQEKQECPVCEKEVGWLGRHLMRRHGYDAYEALEVVESLGADCGYRKQKLRVMAAPYAAMNTTYFLTETYFVGDFDGRDLIILDECDEIQTTADRVYGEEFSEKVLSEFGFALPEKDRPQEWLKAQVHNRLDKVRIKIKERLDMRLDKVEDEQLSVLMDRQPYGLSPMEQEWLQRLLDRAAEAPSEQEIDELDKLGDRVCNALDILADDVVVTIDETAGRRGFKINYIDVAPLLDKHLWNGGDQQFVAMSATPGTLEGWCRVAGVDKIDVDYVHVPHTFPVANRQFRYVNGPNMSRFGYSDPDKVMEMAEVIAKETVGVRTLVLVTSVAQANALAFSPVLADRAFTHQSPPDAKAEAVRRLGESDAGILVSYSMWRGVDLKGDVCRCVVLAKIPWAGMDPLVKARMDAIQGWYAEETAKKIVQGAGRGVRAPDDWCRTIIVDGGYLGAFRRLNGFFPEWFREASR